MRQVRPIFFALLAFFTLTWNASAQETKPHITEGPARVTLGDSQGQLNVQPGFVYVGPEDARRIMAKEGNVHTESLAGLIAQPDSDVDWSGLFRYYDCGYVRDNEARQMDADNLLKGIRENTNESNEKRRERGEPEIEVVGWFQPPAYDQQTHTLSWSIIGQQKNTSERVINYTTLLFGRYGILSCTVVGDPQDGTKLQQKLNVVRSSVSFPQGRDYPSFRSGDRVSELTMTGLITGGAGAAAYGAAKVGLLAKAGKLLIALLLAAKKGIVLVFIGIAAGVKKLAAKLTGKSTDGQV